MAQICGNSFDQIFYLLPAQESSTGSRGPYNLSNQSKDILTWINTKEPLSLFIKINKKDFIFVEIQILKFFYEEITYHLIFI